MSSCARPAAVILTLSWTLHFAAIVWFYVPGYWGLEIVERVRRAVASLPVEQRQVLSLIDLEEFSYCDVAQVLNIPIGTVMSRLHRARKNLLARLEPAMPETAAARGHMRVVK